METYLITAFGQTFLSALVAFLCLIRYQSRDLSIRLIGLIFLTSFFANISAYFLVKTGTFRSLSYIPPIVYHVVAIGLYSWLYFTLLYKKRAELFLVVVGTFAIFSVVNVLFIQKTAWNSYTYFLFGAILIVYCLLYFYVLIKDLPSLHVHHLPMFWINAAILIFHSGVFFLLSFMSYLVNVMKDNLLIYWTFHNGLSIPPTLS